MTGTASPTVGARRFGPFLGAVLAFAAGQGRGDDGAALVVLGLALVTGEYGRISGYLVQLLPTTLT